MVSKILNKIVALIFIIIFIPLWVVTIIAIKLSSIKEPVFYNPIRYGKDKKPFKMYKFRTMKKGARVIDPKNPMLHNESDCRITRLGRILRKLSIDETPQLINVLKGDMDIIGVRPCEYEEIKYLPPERFTVMAGISGVVCRYKKKQPTMEEICEQERYYVQHYGFKVKFKATMNGIMLLWRNK